MRRIVSYTTAGLAAVAALAACNVESEGPAEATAVAGSTTSFGAQPGAVADGLTVVGAGEAAGEPDVLRATVGVEVQRPEVQDALDEANAATEQVLAALDEAGIAPEDRQTRDFSVRPAGEPGDDGAPSGYAVTNLVEATVRDLDTVGSVLDAAVEAGGDHARVHGVHFDLDDDQEQLRAARAAAVADARATAEEYAQLVDAELGELIAIDDQTIVSPLRADDATAAEMAAADSADVPIEPGERDVVVRITTRWSLR